MPRVGQKGWRARQTAPRQVRGRSDCTASNGLHRQRLVDVDAPAVAKQRTALGERGGCGEVGCVDDAVPGKRRLSAIGRPTVGPDRCRCAEGTATIHEVGAERSEPGSPLRHDLLLPFGRGGHPTAAAVGEHELRHRFLQGSRPLGTHASSRGRTGLAAKDIRGRRVGLQSRNSRPDVATLVDRVVS